MYKRNHYGYIIIAAVMLMMSIMAFINVILANQLLSHEATNLPESFRMLEPYLFTELLVVLSAAMVVCYIIKKMVNKQAATTKDFSYNTVIEDEELIARLQQELDKQREMVDKMKKLYSEVVDYDNLRSEFFSNISHELKTPISVILGAIQLIDQAHAAPDENKSARHFHIIKQNCFRLLRLINNILDTTRLEKGYIKTSLETSNIVYLIEEMTQSVVPFAEQKGLSLIFDTEEEEIITAIDIDKLERIMLNLLSNAIKFTPAGGSVAVSVAKKEDKVSISVKDTGPGIPKHMQNKIFERYKQMNSTLTKESEGSGIGLSLVKSFVELHNGTIWVTSEDGKGSNFTIELPIKACNTSPVPTHIYEQQSKIIHAINIEFSDIYTRAS